MSIGTQSSGIVFRIQDAHYPDCLHNEYLSIPINAKVSAEKCDSSSQSIDAAGNCVCLPEHVKVFSRCFSIGTLIGLCLIPLAFLLLLVTIYVLWRKSAKADALWKIAEKDIKYDESAQPIGHGGFGVVRLAEYRGTQVAVEKLYGSSSDAARRKKAHSHQAAYSGDTSTFSGSPSAFNKPAYNVVGKNNENTPQELIESSSDSIGLSGGSVSRSTKGQERRGVKTGFQRTSANKNFVLKDFEADIRILSSLRHPCITTVMGAVLPNKSEPLLVMEYMEHKALSDLLQKSTVALDGDAILVFLRDISQGMQFLHNTEPQVIHGDLKSHNVLIDSMFRAKISDFGVRYKIGVKGTPLWMAPELLRQESDCTAASDVYSFGVTLYEIYARKPPYQNEQDHKTILREICDPKIKRRPPVPQCMPNRVAALMHDCLEANPLERPSMDEIVQRIKQFSSRDVACVQAFQDGSRSHEEESQFFQNLLQRFPRHIAEDLRDGKQVSPEQYECATVLVIELVDFDKVALNLTQKKVFDLITRWHGSLNKLANDQQIFRIETTGDQWMGVTNCGMVDQSGTHAILVAQFALSAVNIASRTWIDPEEAHLGFLQVRVAFHSGPVLTHVVGQGQHNPRFALFGDTVNMAIRMSQDRQYQPGLVHCSSTSAALLATQAPGTFETSLTDRGAGVYWVNAKGQRAAAAHDRIRRKQELRIMRKQQKSRTSKSDDDSRSLSDTSSGTLDFELDCQKDEDTSTWNKHDEIVLEMGAAHCDDKSRNGNQNDDDDIALTNLEGSLHSRLARNHKEIPTMTREEV